MNRYREKILDYARSVIGCAYDYEPSGGVERESYNCSFLTFCAYRYAGLKIPTWQGHQNGNGSQSDCVRLDGGWKWNVSDLIPGDLCFYGSSPYNTYHVGIYVGDGQQIDSIPDGGVQQRFVYDTFCGGGWPFKTEERKIGKVQGLLIVNETCVYFDGHDLHDVSKPECLEPLDKVANAFTGEPLPRVYLSEEEFSRVCQVIRAGMPMHLYDLITKYEPR